MENAAHLAGSLDCGTLSAGWECMIISSREEDTLPHSSFSERPAAESGHLSSSPQTPLSMSIGFSSSWTTPLLDSLAQGLPLGPGTQAGQHGNTAAAHTNSSSGQLQDLRPQQILDSHARVLALVMVDPRWECTPTRLSLSSERMRSRNHCRWLLRMPNLELARPVDTYACTCAHVDSDSEGSWGTPTVCACSRCWVLRLG